MNSKNHLVVHSHDERIRQAVRQVEENFQGLLLSIDQEINVWGFRRDDGIPGSDDVISLLCETKDRIVAEGALALLGYPEQELERVGILLTKERATAAARAAYPDAVIRVGEEDWGGSLHTVDEWYVDGEPLLGGRVQIRGKQGEDMGILLKEDVDDLLSGDEGRAESARRKLW